MKIRGSTHVRSWHLADMGTLFDVRFAPEADSGSTQAALFLGGPGERTRVLASLSARCIGRSKLI
jgi:hypothetical protein